MKNGSKSKSNSKNGKMYDDDYVDRRRAQRERDLARRLKTEQQDGMVADDKFWSLWEKRDDSSHSSALKDLIKKAEAMGKPIVYNNTSTYLVSDPCGVPLDTPIKIASWDDEGYTVCMVYSMEFGYGLQTEKNR